MLIVISGILACLCYLAATVLQTQTILKGVQQGRRVTVLAGIAVAAHAVTTYEAFRTPDGFDLGIAAMLSVMALSIVVIVLLSSLRRPVDNLFVVLFPVALLTVVLEMFPGSHTEPRSDLTTGIFAHILMSVAAYSLLTIAAAQAVLLSFGDTLLRHHQLIILRNLPPLQTMEQLMFEMLWAGLLFLTLSIGTGFVFLEDLSGPGLVHHTVITLAAWVVFAVLLWGRYQLGWRGAVASRWALSGFVLLALGYFGSKVVLEVILGRV